MAKRLGRSHLLIPDVQSKPEVTNEHLEWVGNYVAEKQPDVIVCLGDFADLPSLSSYAVGKAEAEGQRYEKDIEAAKEAMRTLLKPIKKVRRYRPRMVMCLGNHEDRIDREVEANPKWIGTHSTKDLGYEKDWEVYPFLDIVTVDQFEYTHYFTSGVMGRPVTSAAAILRERHCSGTMGHVQTTDIAFHKKSGHIGIFAGCCYLHEEKYLGPQMQGKAQRRQIIMLHEVHDGIADPMLVSLRFLKAHYS